MWFGTSAGLVKYDGYTFKVFTSAANDTSTIPNDHVTTIAEGSDGNLWIGTIEGGLCELRLPEERFRRFGLGGGPLRRVNAIVEDVNRTLWIGTGGSGIYVLGPSRADAKQLDRQTLSSADVLDLAEARDGLILAGTSNGLNLIDVARGRASVLRFTGRDNGPSSDAVRSILLNGDHEVWVGTDKGLDLFDLGRKSFRRGVGGISFVSIVREHIGQYLWLGSFNGLERFNKSDATKSALLSNVSSQERLPENSVRDIYVDNQNTTWIATERGVRRITSRALQFHFYSTGAPSSVKFVSAIAEDPRGTIWLGSVGLQRSTNIVANPMLDGKNVSSLLCDRRGDLWIGTYSGLFRLAAGSARCDSFPYPFGVTAIAEDLEGTLWLSTTKGTLCGVDKFTSQTRYEFRSMGGSPDGLEIQNITRIAVDRNNVLWIATEGFGLFRFDRLRKSFKQFLHNSSIPGTISNNRIYDVFEDHLGTLWVTTGEGLDIMDPSYESFSHLGKEDGFPSASVLNINEDGSGNLWVTANGPWISKLSRNTRRITNYFAEDGFHRTSLMGAFIRTSRSEFIIGGMDGFTRFFPDSIHDHTTPPQVQLTELLLAGTARAFDPLLMKDGLTFSYRENFLGFSFAALDYTNPKRNRHAYRLEGVDDSWGYVEGSRRINYANLAPGSYTLKIKGANSDGYWNEEAIVLPFTIRPPWWETWYFRFAALAVVSSVVFAVHRIRVANLLEKERLRAKISAELHDEIGSGLTRIALLSEVAQRTSLETKAAAPQPAAVGKGAVEEPISKIGNVARELHEALSDVVWSINPVNDTMESFIQRATKYLNEVCEARGIDLSLNVGNEIASLHAQPELLHNLLLITKESITNTVRHSQCSNVSVHITSNARHIELTISDNGRGFEAAAVSGGNGLRNMKKRVDQLAGELAIRAKAGEGTTLFCSIPIRKK